MLDSSHGWYGILDSSYPRTAVIQLLVPLLFRGWWRNPSACLALTCLDPSWVITSPHGVSPAFKLSLSLEEDRVATAGHQAERGAQRWWGCWRQVWCQEVSPAPWQVADTVVLSVCWFLTTFPHSFSLCFISTHTPHLLLPVFRDCNSNTK